MAKEAEEVKLCRDCARPIPKKARRCIHDNCGAYQDWRRFLGTQPNLLSAVTLFGVLITIVFNIYQVRDLANKASKQDINKVKEGVAEEVRESIAESIPRLKKEIADLEKSLLTVPDEYVNRYKRFLELPRSGIIKLFPRGKLEDVMLTRGAGAYFSFARRTHEYGQGSDIEFQENSFIVGFAGADYGFIMELGDIPIQDVVDSAQRPLWLSESKSEAWSHIWNYSPPDELAKLRIEGRKYQRGEKIGSTILRDQVPAIIQQTYLLRSVNVRDSDILVVFRAEATLDDDSIVLVWRILQQKSAPQGTGPDI